MKSLGYSLILGIAVISTNSAEAQSNLEFEGANRTPIPYSPHEISEPDGKPVDPSKKAVLKLSGDVRNQLSVETNDVKNSLKGMGYEVLDRANDKILQTYEVTAKEYLDEFNNAERSLNGLGHTLKNVAKITEREVQKLDASTIEKQVEEAAEIYVNEAEAEYKKRKAEAEATWNELKAQIEEYKVMASSTTKEEVYLDGQDKICAYTDAAGNSIAADDAQCFVDALNKGAPNNPLLSPEPSTCTADTPMGKAWLVNKTWSDGGGDKKFGWSAQANYEVFTDARGIGLNAKASASASVLNKSYDIIEIYGSFVSPRKGKPSSTRYIKILGKQQTSKNENWDLTLLTSKNENGEETLIQNTDQPIASQTFVVGFVPVVVKVDSRVDVGPRYALDLVPVGIKGRFEYVTKVSVIASAGIGADLKFFLILAGIRGSIDLFNTTTGIYPELGLYLDEENRPQISARVAALSEMITMSGQLDIGVWAKTTFSVPVPNKSWPFLELKPLSYEWTQTLGRYPGYKFPTAVLFDEKIGYDVCSGRKQVDVLGASAPRSREERKSYAELENERVNVLENAFLDLYSQKQDLELERKVSASFASTDSGLSGTVLQVDNLLRELLIQSL